MTCRWTKKNKFNAKKTVTDGIRFDSKKEAKRYSDLCILQRAGTVAWFLRQVPFDCGGGVKYRLDFMVFWDTGEITFEDVKGFKTPLYKAKKKLIEAKYPIEIMEI